MDTDIRTRVCYVCCKNPMLKHAHCVEGQMTFPGLDGEIILHTGTWVCDDCYEHCRSVDQMARVL